MTEEIFDVVDDQDRIFGQETRANVHARGLNHRAVHVLLFNTDGNLFLQRRAATKDTYPGRYDSSASGHLVTGEDYDACAVREVAEELGLQLSPEQIAKHFKIAACAETGREFVWVYSARGDFHPVVNLAEISEGEYWPVAKIAAAIRDRPADFAPAFVRVFAEFRAIVRP